MSRGSAQRDAHAAAAGVTAGRSGVCARARVEWNFNILYTSTPSLPHHPHTSLADKHKEERGCTKSAVASILERFLLSQLTTTITIRGASWCSLRPEHSAHPHRQEQPASRRPARRRSVRPPSCCAVGARCATAATL